MSKKYDADSFFCEEIFDGKDGIYEIPPFQRPYSWAEEEVEQLFDDLYEAWQKGERSYYLGPIIVVGGSQEDNDSGRTRKELIDGQQRLTTLTLLYATYKHCFKDKLSKGNKIAVDQRLKEETLVDSLERRPFRLRVGVEYNNQFEQSILEDWDLDANNRYTKMASLLKENLESVLDTDEEFNNFFNFIENSVELVKIETGDLRDGIRVFLTINTRGKELSLSDKFKSYLLSQMQGEARDNIVGVWRGIVNMVDDNFDLLDDILRSFRLYRKEKRAEKDAFTELKEEIDKSEPSDIVDELEKFTECYLKVTENYSEFDKTVQKKILMLRALHHDQWRTIAAVAEKEDVTYFSQLMEWLVALYYSYNVAGYTAAKTKNRSYKILKKVKENAGIDEIKAYIEQQRERHEVRERAKENLNSEDVTEGNWHKRLLVALEYTMATDRVIDEIELGEGTHREHVLPDQCHKAMKNDGTGEWKKSFEGKDPESLKDRLGNLVLIQYDINESIKQKPYSEKRKFYRGKKAPEGKEKKETSFRITRNLAEEPEWTPDRIKQHTEHIIAKTEKLLKVPEGSLRTND